MTSAVPDFAGISVLCIGDVMLDRFMRGSVQRISPESPVPIILLKAAESVPGGAANVGRNISALGGRCTLIGCVGEDAAAAELAAQLSTCGRITPSLVPEPGRVTIEKTRFVAQGQHLLRADQESVGDVSAASERAIVDRVERLIAGHHAVVLSDYAKGVLTPAVVSGIIAIARKAGVPVIVDPKSPDLSRYAGATVVTPNAKEAKAATGIDPHEDDGAERAGQAALAASGIEAILLTRGERGMSLVRSGATVVHLPASARDVFDVVGAGDTVVATLALCIGAGMPLESAAAVANAAAGLVVGKHGTATVDRSELQDELKRLAGPGPSSAADKVMERDAAIDSRGGWARDGLKVGFTNGCFDILHVGHLAILEFARAQCDRLIVGVNSDASIRRLKGPTRPINSQEDRARMIAGLGAVDLVVIFDEDTPGSLIELLVPDLLVKGADYSIDQIVGADTVLAHGGTVLTCPLVPGRSTTGIIARSAAAPQVSA